MPSSPTNLPLIRLSAVNPFLLELTRRKVNVAAMMKEMSLPEMVPASDEVFIPAQMMYQLVEKTAEVAGDPFLGFSVGQNLDLTTWGPITKAVAEASTVGELLSRFIVNALDYSSSTRFFLRTEGDRSTFGLERIAEPSIVPAQNDAFYLGFLSRMFRRATGTHWEPNSVLVKVADPEALPSVLGHLRIARGDHLGIQIRFPTEWQFKTLVKSASHENSQFTTASQIPGSLIDSIHLALAPHIHEPNLSVDRAAEICGFGRRHLGRDLRQRGTTLAKEIAQLRAARAGKVLVDSDRRISDVARSVGFVDPTVFSRAFKNWTGQSPQQYRKLHRT
jgi:AraC-like DNA-binding protein